MSLARSLVIAALSVVPALAIAQAPAVVPRLVITPAARSVVARATCGVSFGLAVVASASGARRGVSDGLC